MIDPVAGHAIVFNGEIYNFQHLRDQLVSAGQQFSSTGDTVVMLRALATQGPDATKTSRHVRLRLWDPHQRELLLARDPLGIKPLYYCQNPDPNGSWSLIFASEIRSILAAGLLPHPRLDPTAIASVVWNASSWAPTRSSATSIRYCPAN